MKNDYSLALDFIQFIQSKRQCGSTTSLVKGAKDTDAFIITHNAVTANDIIRECNVKAVCWKNFRSICGLRCSIVIEKEVFIEICDILLTQGNKS